MINSVEFSGIEKPVNTNAKTNVKQENKTEIPAGQEAYVVDIGRTPEKKVTYDKPAAAKPDINKIEQLKKEADDALRPLRQLVEELLKKQGMSFNDAKIKPNEGEMVVIDDKTRAEAQRLISDGGEYSIENTSDRLLEFAKAVSGGDKSKFNELKSAIEQGYQEAEKAFGGALPEISKKTLDATMEKLNKWATSDEE